MKLKSKDFLRVPRHIIDQDLMLTRVPGDTDKQTGKHGSLTTIFSVWNAMVGTGLLTIPWAYSEAGLLLGVFLTFVAFFLSFMTQYFVMVAARDDLDFTETLKRNFGLRGWYFGMFVFVAMLTIPIMLYSQLLAQMLYPILYVVFKDKLDDHSATDHHHGIGSLAPDFTKFSYSYTCFIVFLVLMTLGEMKQINIFIKINTVGVLFTIIIIVFICSIGVASLSTQTFKVEYQPVIDAP